MLSKVIFAQKFIKPVIPCLSLSFKFSNETTGKRYVSVLKNESKKTANVTMHRLPVNSLNLELLNELIGAVDELEENEYKGMILYSSCPTVFSAGLDILEMYQPDESRLRKFWQTLQDMWKTLYLTPMVTIAAINGHCPAGGCVLSMSCDHSIMVNSRATIGLNETLLGIVAPKWFRTLYVNTIGFRRAEHALKLGKIFTPKEALEIRLVDQLVDSPADLSTKAEEELDKWLKIPRTAMQMTKRSLREQYVDELISYEKQEVEEFVYFITQESTQKFLGKYLESLKVKK